MTEKLRNLWLKREEHKVRSPQRRRKKIDLHKRYYLTWLFVIWWLIGYILQVFWTVPESLGFSKPFFLLLYALCMLEISGVMRNMKLLFSFLGFGVACYVLEVASVHFSIPFGTYGYTSVLGSPVYGVPFTIVFAWIAVFINCWGLAISAGRFWQALETACYIVLFDLILDPVAIFEGYWEWNANGFYYGIPLQNFLSWFVIAFLFALLLNKHHSKSTTKRMIFVLYGMQILLFSSIAAKHGEFLVFLIGIVILVIGGSLYYARSKKQ
ncbi:hypothetical protein HMPREF0556_10341 [Listeria grayi DSM 20601]|uniref:Carotene biosynthesis associated membrane protein n=1 Tax=Listeria grayi DSM 20601 TaxID=525367 RepID=D7UV66_LISGR|nr:hypothetical protein HMPREF0556_10341 [Listeria grayi DSM 20601]